MVMTTRLIFDSHLRIKGMTLKKSLVDTKHQNARNTLLKIIKGTLVRNVIIIWSTIHVTLYAFCMPVGGCLRYIIRHG